MHHAYGIRTAYVLDLTLEVFNPGDHVVCDIFKLFVQYEDLQDARTLFSEDEREVDPDSPAYVDRKLHLRSIDLSEGADHNRITDHGPIIDQDGRAARMIMSMAADDQGHVFTYGSWHVNSFKEATLQYLLFEYPGGDLYRLVKRGEFFAVINAGK